MRGIYGESCQTQCKVSEYENHTHWVFIFRDSDLTGAEKCNPKIEIIIKQNIVLKREDEFGFVYNEPVIYKFLDLISKMKSFA